MIKRQKDQENHQPGSEGRDDPQHKEGGWRGAVNIHERKPGSHPAQEQAKE